MTMQSLQLLFVKGDFARLVQLLAQERKRQEAEMRRERRCAVVELRRAHDEMELRIHKCAAELTQANEMLRAEIAERKLKEVELQKAKDSAEEYAQRLEFVLE